MATGSDSMSRDPFVVPLGVRMRNQKLRTIRPVEWCVHAQPEVAPYPPMWGLLTVNDVNRRASPEKYGSGNPFGCSLGLPRLSFSSPGYLPLLFSFLHIKFVVFGCVRYVLQVVNHVLTVEVLNNLRVKWMKW